jgi:hypothetical protein
MRQRVTDLLGQAGHHALQTLALQVRQVMTELAGQRCQRPVPHPEPYNLAHQRIRQLLGQYRHLHTQHLGRRLASAGHSGIIQHCHLRHDLRPQALQQCPSPQRPRIRRLEHLVDHHGQPFGLATTRRIQLGGCSKHCAGRRPPQGTLLLIAERQRSQLLPARIRQQANQPITKIISYEQHIRSLSVQGAARPRTRAPRTSRLPRRGALAR